MALRPIDNALPVAPERPKKHLQVVSVPLQKQSEVGVNDENKAPLPPSNSPIDYISSDNLKPISDPESKIQVRLFFLFLMSGSFFISVFS